MKKKNNKCKISAYKLFKTIFLSKIFQGGSCYFDTHHNPSLTLIDLYELVKHHFQHKNRSYDEPSQC